VLAVRRGSHRDWSSAFDRRRRGGLPTSLPQPSQRSLIIIRLAPNRQQDGIERYGCRSRSLDKHGAVGAIAARDRFNSNNILHPSPDSAVLAPLHFSVWDAICPTQRRQRRGGAGEMRRKGVSLNHIPCFGDAGLTSKSSLSASPRLCARTLIAQRRREEKN
jgi:hypothetical protein